MIFYYLIVLFFTICNKPVMSSSWEFAVVTSEQISFFDSNWKRTTDAAHRFNDLSAITFDETKETLYFNTRSGNNSNIFSLKLSDDDFASHSEENILQKTDGEMIEALAFDLLEGDLYWTDYRRKIIYQATVGKTVEPTVLMNFTDDRIPRGIAVDPCRRRIYYTNSNNSNPSIESAMLDGSNRKVLISNKGDDKILFMPMDIAVDQYSERIYWVDNLEGNHFAVESAALDGTDRRTLVRDVENSPYGITVDRDNVYWTDHTHQAVWKIAKDSTATEKVQPEKVLKAAAIPMGIISKNHLLSTQATNPACKTVLSKVHKDIFEGHTTEKAPSSTTPRPQDYCLNNGTIIPNTSTCICQPEFHGARCEVPVCHNYCIQGACSVTSTGYASCKCDAGYSGERCEVDLCQGFCLNGGRCGLERGEPVCYCTSSFSGRHCESKQSEKLCKELCENGNNDAGDHDLAKICEDYNNNNSTNLLDPSRIKLDEYPHYQCNDALYRTITIACVGVVASLTLIILIVKSMRRIYQPLRPRIKKTYVVTKNVTPLTCRPTTEQCEITIEDCCNMNICDTPCFDPKSIQAESKKEDKKNLLSNMDGDLY